MNFLNVNQITTKESWLENMKPSFLDDFDFKNNDYLSHVIISNILKGDIMNLPDGHYIYILYTYPFCQRWIDVPVIENGFLSDKDYENLKTCIQQETEIPLNFKRIKYQGFNIHDALNRYGKRDIGYTYMWDPQEYSDIMLIHIEPENYLMLRLAA